MIDNNARCPEVRPNPPAAGGYGAFQFSLMSMFVVTTALALVLSAFFGVGRLIGMSTSEVLTQGLGRFAFSSPLLLVWIIGLTIAIRRLKRDRLPAVLATIALGGLVLSSFASSVVLMAFLYAARSGRIGIEAFSWYSTVISALYAIVHPICWILILVAIFFRRPADVPAPQAIGEIDDCAVGPPAEPSA